MVTPDIETSTREERLEFIREEFKCLGNCPICGKCSFLKEREAEDQYAATSKVTVLSGLYRKEVDKAFAQVFRGFGADALHPHGFDASLQRAAEPTLFLF